MENHPGRVDLTIRVPIHCLQTLLHNVPRLPQKLKCSMRFGSFALVESLVQLQPNFKVGKNTVLSDFVVDMPDDSLFHFDSSLACLICKVHGHAVHPNAPAIIRHLRSKSHRLKGARLQNVLAWCMQLPLCPEPNQIWVQNSHLQPPSHLRVLDGFSCELCPEPYLTTSLELMQRHASKYHRQRLRSKPWHCCKMQTLFEETRLRHYRRLGERRQSPCLSDPEDGFFTTVRATTLYNISDYHPMALTAARHVPYISLSALDAMFKSDSFRLVSRPLFSPENIDSDNAMFAVFPGSHLDTLFFQALVHALIGVCPERRVPQAQHIYLESLVVKLLNDRIESFQKTRRMEISTIGAMLLLKVTSYKLGDAYQHDIHTNGVLAALRVSNCAALPETLRRGIFWQDLYAAVLLRSQRLFGDFMAYESFDSLPFQPLPVGFSRVGSQLGQNLRECIVDTIKFNKVRNELQQQAWSSRYRRLDGMQASIESRLEAMTHRCRQISPLAEVVRLATLFWCYCSWMEIWNDTYVPCQILRQMLDALDQSLSDPDDAPLWLCHLDLLHWLLFMVRDVTRINNWHTKQIAPRYRDMLELAGSLLTAVSADDLDKARFQSEHDFVPSPPWRTRESGEATLCA